jgi:putative intracellular protease/amidase
VSGRWRLLVLMVALLLPRPTAASEAPYRPRVVLLANNSGTETTDLLVPFAVLRDADVADVAIVGVASGPVSLMPALTIEPDATLADRGAPPDVVVVAAMHDPTAPALLEAVRTWAETGALVVSICDGAWVLAQAGLLDGRAATSHWYSIPRLRREYPRTAWRQDVRWVRDGRLLTSAGVSASLPVAQHLVELLRHGDVHGDQQRVGPPHDGARFTIGTSDVAAGAGNYLLPWRHETVAVPLADGIDELALGIALDLLDRTYAVRTVTFAPGPVQGRRGLRLVPDVATALPPPTADRVAAIDTADFDVLLADIEHRYGAATRNLVALQIEYSPRRD